MADEPVKTESDAVESWVFKNNSGTEVVIQDLGYKAPSGMFSPEVFKPNETKDLRTKYSLRELRNSKSLVIAVDEMKCLTRGSGDGPPLPDNALRRAVELNKNTEGFAFQDPTRNVFDDKLDELREKERKEDERTKRRA